jgi:hypothetical protein
MVRGGIKNQKKKKKKSQQNIKGTKNVLILESLNTFFLVIAQGACLTPPAFFLSGPWKCFSHRLAFEANRNSTL